MGISGEDVSRESGLFEPRWKISDASFCASLSPWVSHSIRLLVFCLDCLCMKTV